ncbi:uncharacterized protein [Euwallacea similis]|uniref:uncharacterized protein n=1 Tax=Euwallacea similis TaxID=1736056 RepID=UPI00344FB3B2
MENIEEPKVTEYIVQEECAQSLECEDQEIGEVEAEDVVPFHLIKIQVGSIDTNIKEDGEYQSYMSLPDIPDSKRFTQYNTSVKGKYSKYYRQTYRTAWELMPDFKGWLKGVKGQPTKAFCIYCRKVLHAHRLSLLKHTCTIRHQKAAQVHNSPCKYDTVKSDEKGEIINNDPEREDRIHADEEGSSDVNETPIVYMSQVKSDEKREIMNNDLEREDSINTDEDASSCANEAPIVYMSQMDLINEDALVPPISTQVTDTTTGKPVSGLLVSLYKLIEGRWTYINEGVTNTKGHYSDLFKTGGCTFGRYKLHFDVDRYFDSKQQKSIFPFIEIVFDITTSTPLHFPLLLSPNSYTTYKSSYAEHE